MSVGNAQEHLWQVLEAQADDLFALYQLSQVLADANDVDELAPLALSQLVRVCDSPYAALFLPDESARGLHTVAWIGPDPDAEQQSRSGGPAMRPFASAAEAAAWFQESCGLDAGGCTSLALAIGGPMPGLVTLASPHRGGFEPHQQHLLNTMTREVARVLQLALARSELRRRQEQTEQMQADFVAAVSHELRTPLALIQASVDSLVHLPLSGEQQRDSIQDIGRASVRLARIVDAILDFSRIEEGRRQLRIESVDLAGLVEDVTRECDEPSRRRLQVLVPPITVLADPARTAQALSNLVSNALKYSSADTPVRLRARVMPGAGVACLEVRDCGWGIPVEDQPYLFTKFFRASNVRASHLAGTGLGLYIARRLVEAQGGALRLRSRVGWGTSVRLTLPLA